MTGELGRRPYSIFEIDFPRCTHTYGEGDCPAFLADVDGRRNKCYNSRKTCQAIEAYSPATVTHRYVMNVDGMPKQAGFFPMLKSVSTRAAEINLSGIDPKSTAMGVRARGNASLANAQDNGSFTDPYAAERRTGAAQWDGVGYNPGNVGTHLGKLFARQPYYVGLPCRVKRGYVGDDPATMPVEHYVISEAVGPGSSGVVNITYKDVFDLAESDKALAPAVSTGKLIMDISAEATSAELTPTGAGDGYDPLINHLIFTASLANAAWEKTSGTTVSDNSGIAPDGTTTATKVNYPASNRTLKQNVSLPTGVYTASLWIKGTVGETIRFEVKTGAATTHTLTGEWDFISVDAVADPVRWSLNTFGGATAREVYVWQPQIELGAVAGAYQRVDAEHNPSGLVRIGREIIAYTRVGDVLTFTERGAEGTEITSHDEMDVVQVCLVYDPMRPCDVGADLLRNYANVSTDQIPILEWREENDRWLGGMNISRTIISKPTGVLLLIGELSQIGVMFYPDVEAGVIRYKVNSPLAPGEDHYEISEDLNIIEGSVDLKRGEDMRISAILLYHGVLDWTDSLTSTRNYSKVTVAQVGDDPYDQESIKEMTLRWYGREGDSASASVVTERLLARYQTPPRVISGALDVKDRVGVSLAETLRVTCSLLEDENGGGQPELMQVNYAEYTGDDRVKFRAETYKIGGRFAFWMDNPQADYSTATEDEKDRGAFWMDDTIGVFSDGTGPYLYF